MSRHAPACHAVHRVTDQHRLALTSLPALTSFCHRCPAHTPAPSSAVLPPKHTCAGMPALHAWNRSHQVSCHPPWRVAGGPLVQLKMAWPPLSTAKSPVRTSVVSCPAAGASSRPVAQQVPAQPVTQQVSRSRCQRTLGASSRAPVRRRAESVIVPATRRSHKTRPSRQAAQGAANGQASLHGAATPGAPLRSCAPAHVKVGAAGARQLRAEREPACARAGSAAGRPRLSVRRALAGAGTRPCVLHARLPCGMRASSSARCCSRSTAASAGPPPTRRTGCRTCTRTDVLASRVLHDSRLLTGTLRAAERRTPSTSSPPGAARACAGAGPPGWPPAGPPRRCAARPRPRSARRRPPGRPSGRPRSPALITYRV